MAKIKPMAYAMVLGALFALIINQKLLKKETPETNLAQTNSVEVSSEKQKILAFQVGVFKENQNAIALKKEYPTSLLVKDGEYTRVFVGLTNEENCTLFENYYKNKNISYYLKEIFVPSAYYEKFISYMNLLSKQPENLEAINEESIKAYEESVQ